MENINKLEKYNIAYVLCLKLLKYNNCSNQSKVTKPDKK